MLHISHNYWPNKGGTMVSYIEYTGGLFYKISYLKSANISTNLNLNIQTIWRIISNDNCGNDKINYSNLLYFH